MTDIPQRVDQGYAHLIVAGRDCGVWPIAQGGGKSAQSNKTRLGYGLDEFEMGGPGSVADMTLERQNVVARDGTLWAFLFDQVGKGECVVTKVTQDTEYNVVDSGRPRKGKLLVCNEPDLDINAQDAAMVHLEFGMHGSIG